MISFFRRILIGAVGAGMLVTGALAQQSTNQITVSGDWSVYAEPAKGKAKECWGVSAPLESISTRKGQRVTPTRGDILLFVTYRAGGGKGEVSFTGGYDFAPASVVKLDVDGAKFDLFTDGRFAWPADSKQDAQVVAALKKGSKAIVTGTSARGTETKDSFSLKGISNALKEAAQRCGG